MRHRKDTVSLGRNRSERDHLARDLCNALFLHGTSVTTQQNAAFARRIAQPAITTARRGTLASKRQIHALLNNKEVEEILRTQIAMDYASRPGGYTRVTKLMKRQGDAAQLVRLELV